MSHEPAPPDGPRSGRENAPVDRGRTSFSAIGLAREIREGRLSAVEALEAHLDRVARLNPSLNAVVTLDEARARDRARAADRAVSRGELWGPLHGVPFTAKDVFETEGLRTTAGHPPLANYVPKTDATVVARLKGAGAVLAGKTNTSELARDAQTYNPVFGRTANPWNPSRTPGGSTGGGAAAVAAGLSPLELGSDIAGSIRVPAHFCGVFGLKPTRGRVSGAGHIPPLPGTPKGADHLGTFGPIARSVEDLRLCLSVVSGPDGRDHEVAPVPLGTPAERDLAELRIAWTDGLGDLRAGKETRKALEGLARDLGRLGCRVEEREPAVFAPALAWRTYWEIYGAENPPEVPARARRLLGDIARLAPDDGWFPAPGVLRGAGFGMRGYAEALDRRDELVSQLESFLGRFDAWLLPVTVGTAFTHRPAPLTKIPEPIEVDGREIPYHAATLGFTVPFSLTGNPVVALPVSRSAEGLPIGAQLVGRRWQEADLLGLAEALKGATRPPEHPPLAMPV